ncbi:hypothetical protein [Clostridium perfringens]|uniref:Uncharacterized protein n=2 Tax=Clostridium perfringens TaxID=1502 RepID=A0AAP6WKA8_CLOPF|nr:hypothetical protein [Clostridium perfringens]EDT24511.1 hypothetical protein AC1_1293 [Clostridium perfringens B str. ATCC 3626]NGT59356.1 hypothetical protein [Clostridium perfringens]NGU28556.1 hypothetical protein [Clostridium perfringens]WEV06510.1 hypothetical protein PL322_05885 [Clostridium perfringens B]WEV09604.1 hypothetical protein PL324_06160 [Clostridium perfringens B]
MKRSIKALILVVLITILSLNLIACSSSNKALDKGKELINEGQYEKAVVSLDENPKNKEAKELKDMIENYLEASKALDEGKIRKAEVKIQNVGEKSNEFPNFKKCVDALNKNIDEKSEYDKDIKSDMEKLEKFIDNKNYSDAVLLTKSLDGRVRTKEQKEKLEQIKLKLISVLSIESTKK